MKTLRSLWHELGGSIEAGWGEVNGKRQYWIRHISSGTQYLYYGDTVAQAEGRAKESMEIRVSRQRSERIEQTKITR